jgi:hypothetical protein
VAQDDPEMITMDNICWRPPVTVTEKAGVLEALQIMRQHGGTLTVKSTVGKGTEFAMRF